MLRFQLHDDKNNQITDLGLIGDFVKEVVKDMRDINFRSRLFSTKGIVEQDQLDKEFSFALDRVIQRMRDERGR